MYKDLDIVRGNFDECLTNNYSQFKGACIIFEV